MPASVRHHVQTLADYLAAERLSPSKHEFADGQILVMAGGSPRHNRIETNTARALGRLLQGRPCFEMTSNQRIATGDGLYTYADGSVFRGGMTVGPDQTATDPVLLVEVLSDSTRDYDRGEKLERYRSIPSLQHVLLVEQRSVDVELWSRTAEGWRRAVYVAPDAAVPLPALGIDLPIADLYDGAERFPT